MTDKLAETVGPATLQKVLKYNSDGQEIALNGAMVKQWLVKPTKAGKMPSDGDVLKFLMLCRSQKLNPWVGDAFLVGYDSQTGPEFSMISSHASLLKRADRQEDYEGLDSGVIVKRDGEIVELVGKFRLDEDVLLGAWAEVKVKDKKFGRKKVRIQAFAKENKFWKRDREGMITKCCEAAALREAFPNILSGSIIREEMTQAIDITADAEVSEPITTPPKLEQGKNVKQTVESPEDVDKKKKPKAQKVKKPKPPEEPDPAAAQPGEEHPETPPEVEDEFSHLSPGERKLREAGGLAEPEM
jgi:phage recombination protein Bet